MKTRTGALHKSAGFPGTDRVKNSHANKTTTIHESGELLAEQVFGMPFVATTKAFEEFWEEQLRQSDKSHDNI